MQTRSHPWTTLPWAGLLARVWQYYRFPILFGLALRAGSSLWLGLIWWMVDPYFPLSGKPLWETYGRLVPHASRLGRALFDVWLRWDAVHYMNIAHQGYAGVGQGDLNFFPLYPYLTLLLKSITGLHEVEAGLLLSTGLAILSFCLLYRLVDDLFQDLRLARWSVIAWGVYPTSFFLFAPYTEAIFSTCALGCLLLMYRRQWAVSGLLAALTGLARAQGLLLALPMLTIAYQDWRDEQRMSGQAGQRMPWHALSGLALAPLGFLGFTVWRTWWGIGFFTQSYSQFSEARFVDPIRGYINAILFAIHVHDYISISEVISATLFLALIGWMIFQPRYRAYPALLVYSLANLALFMVKHNLAASPIQSTNRYVISLFPVFIALGDLLLRLPERGRKLYVALSLALLVTAATLQALWLFVG